MASIPGYTRGFSRQAEIANTVDPQAISRAASGFNAVAQAADIGAQVSMKIQEADDSATLNEMLITREREKIDFIDAAKKQYEGAPEGFSAYIEKEMQKKDAATISSLPTRLQQPFKLTADRSNLADYEQNKGWETDRRVAVVGDKIGRAGREISGLAYTYGASGKEFNEILPNIDATMVAGSGVLAPEKLLQFDEGLRSDAAKQYIAGVMTRDPQAANDLVNSELFSKFLTPDESAKVKKAIWDATPDLLKIEQINGGRQPLSVRNNNPGNIRGADGEFKKFATPEEGQKAMADDLRVKISGKSAAMKNKFGADYQPTLSNLIHTWAPTNENDTAAYIDTVAKETGIGAGQVLTVADIPKLQAAMTKVEGGQSAANYFTTGTAFDSMAYGEKLNEIEKIKKAVMTDPVKSAMQYGASTPHDIVAAQAKFGIDPIDARLLTNQQASELGKKINASKDSEEVLTAAIELREAYGEYAENAAADLIANGDLRPEMNAAMSLAIKGRPEYRRHIDLLTQAANAKDDKDMNALFKARGFDEKSLSLPSSYVDMEQAILNEGNPDAISYVQSQRQVLVNLAKMSMIYDGLSYSKAMDFAVKPVMDSYDTGYINGVYMRVPKQYDAGIIENAVEDFIDVDLPKMLEQSGSKDYKYSKDFIIPVLNSTRDGVQFITAGVGAITDKQNKPIDVKFDYLLSTKKAPAKEFKPIPKGAM